MGISSGVYRIAARLGIRRFGRLVAVLIILTNSSLVYESTTAMTEPTLMMWLVASVAGLTRWTLSKRDLSAGELMVFAGLPAAAALLSRYEGWALTFVGTLVVALVAWRRRKDVKYAIKMAFAFALWPFIALSWWLIYNFAVFGNPLEFANGQYSASALQVGLPNKGFLLYQGYAGLTIWTYAWALIQTVGIVVILLGLIGAFVLTWRRGLDNHALMVWMLAVPSAFIIFAMYVGQTVMSNDHALPAALWNNRFALSALPFLGILVAYLCQSLVDKSRFKRLGLSLIALAITFQAAWWVVDLNHSAVFAEATASTAQKVDSGAQAAMRYLGANYDGGSILIDESGGILPEIGIPLREYYNVSIGDLYLEALADPVAYVRWVFMRIPTNGNGDGDRGDAIYGAVGELGSFLSNYEEVYESGPFRIYRRIGN
ncbi:MAG: phospholipid carrier-dependent glycosyltransferase [Actinomycetota bacterium]|nr:phospholipid carrier-dependent glycosyltransferase [Actinomycetota bacterium]